MNLQQKFLFTDSIIQRDGDALVFVPFLFLNQKQTK